MTIVNMHEAKTQLSRLVAAATEGETVVIAKAGRPVAKLIAADATQSPRRLGFLNGQAMIPSDFDTIMSLEVELLFGYGRR